MSDPNRAARALEWMRREMPDVFWSRADAVIYLREFDQRAPDPGPDRSSFARALLRDLMFRKRREQRLAEVKMSSSWDSYGDDPYDDLDDLEPNEDEQRWREDMAEMARYMRQDDE